MMLRKLSTLIPAYLLVAQTAFAGLSPRDMDGDPGNGHEGLYDDVLDVTWLADANLTDSNQFGVPLSTNLGPHPSDTSGVDGLIQASFGSTIMNWPGALFWVDAMNGANYLGQNQWRLPVADEGCTPSSFGCDTSELGRMFYVNLGGTSGNDVTTTGDPQALALISNLQGSPYWSDTIWSGGSLQVWSTNYFNGLEFVPLKQFDTYYAWPVVDGDAGTPLPPPVPAFPGAPGFFGLAALIAAIGVRRMRRR